MTTQIKHIKMHSCHNYFVVVDVRRGEYGLEEIRRAVPEFVAMNKGECDQVLVLVPSRQADCRMVVYNADGSESGMCANGLRCVGLMLAKRRSAIEIAGRVYQVAVKADGVVSVNIGKPHSSGQLAYARAGFADPIVVDVGNPHVVFFVDSEREVNVNEVGKEIGTDRSVFAQGANVSFVVRVDENNLVARTWERGVGETGACGSAACAIAWAAWYRRLADNPVTVRYGDSEIVVEQHADGSLESTAIAVMMETA